MSNRAYPICIDTLRGNYQNVASQKIGAILYDKDSTVVVGGKGNLLDNENKSGNQEFYVQTTNHITVKLLQAYQINTVYFHLWDGDSRTYDLEVQISEDYKVWRSVFKSNQAKGHQFASFEEQKVRYIRFLKGSVGNTANNYLHLKSVKAYFEF